MSKKKFLFFCTHLIPSIYTVNIARGNSTAHNIVCVCKDTKKKQFRWEIEGMKIFFLFMFLLLLQEYVSLRASGEICLQFTKMGSHFNVFYGTDLTSIFVDIFFRCCTKKGFADIYRGIIA